LEILVELVVDTVILPLIASSPVKLYTRLTPSAPKRTPVVKNICVNAAAGLVKNAHTGGALINTTRLNKDPIGTTRDTTYLAQSMFKNAGLAIDVVGTGGLSKSESLNMIDARLLGSGRLVDVMVSKFFMRSGFRSELNAKLESARNALMPTPVEGVLYVVEKQYSDTY
jgi:hypothetical protein